MAAKPCALKPGPGVLDADLYASNHSPKDSRLCKSKSGPESAPGIMSSSPLSISSPNSRLTRATDEAPFPSPTLDLTGRLLTQSFNTIASSADDVNSAVSGFNSILDKTPHGCLTVDDIFTIRNAAEELNALSAIPIQTSAHLKATADDALLEKAILNDLTRLGKQGPDASVIHPEPRALLEFFDSPIHDIIKAAIAKPTSQRILLRVADRCHVAMSRRDGALNADRYIAHLRAKSGRQSASNWRSQRRAQFQLNSAIHKGREWARFWTRALISCPGGPTLFSASNTTGDLLTGRASSQLPDVPPFLVRLYTDTTYGKNNDQVMIPPGSLSDISNPPPDVLSMNKLQATILLQIWLAPSTKPEESDTNIFRWTSSLLAVIKHATKLSHLGADLSSLKICIVDTRMFPRGQFAPGKWVIDSCDPINTSELSPQSPQSPPTNFRRTYAANEAREYLRFYLGDGEGGEDYFMSQGKLHIADRSSTVSLEDLIDAGLYQLYPELDPVNGSAMSLTDLRSRWSEVSVPKQREKNLATALGRRLVQGSNLDAPSASLMFLYFKSREQARSPLTTHVRNAKKMNQSLGNQSLTLRLF
jgi:hypothetical protein